MKIELDVVPRPDADTAADTAAMWLVYVDHDGTKHYQPWQDLTDAGTLINEFGNDMEMVGWTTAWPT